MPCERIGNAIVCSRGRRRKAQLCACGSVSTRLCDWKIGKPAPGEKQRTCDVTLCHDCTHEIEVNPGAAALRLVDLCPNHAEAWKRLQAARGQTEEA